MKPIVKQFKYGKHTIILETGAMARQADAAVMASMDDTSVFVTVCGVKDAVGEDRDFFPLTVDYQERSYAAGRIPGGYFKREGRPSEGETLIARLIDTSVICCRLATQWSQSGHTSHFGAPFGRQTTAPNSIKLCVKSPQRSLG